MDSRKSPKAQGDKQLFPVSDNASSTFIRNTAKCPQAIAISDGNTALHLAAQVGFVEGVEELLLHGADTEAIDLTGCTPLIQACQKRQEAVIQLLIKSGSDVNHFSRVSTRISNSFRLFNLEER
ncbi:unnamed protein product [Dibothriocephalus latus]|uniref:Uncharacterized protein n=1 Tax=Dibothriocephalus latus TaxID=60516 RepID=A0A3P7PJK2_DIBLA|nr:unnamed protein product [Dibothriocephalus latus]